MAPPPPGAARLTEPAPHGPRILFITSNRIGDAVISCGILDYLIQTQPTCRISIVCGPVAAGVFARLPNRAETILFQKLPFDRHWWRLWKQVVGTRWDLIVDLRQSAIAYVLRAGRRAVKRRGTQGLRKFEQLAATIGASPAPLPVVWTAPEDRLRAAQLLPAPIVIGFGPTANWPPKAWPPQRFAALFHALAERMPGAVPAVFGGPGPQERAMAAPLLGLLPNAVDLCGVLTLPEAAACLQRCTVFIGNDSGLMHMAAAAGTPTIGLCSTTRDRAVEMAPAGLHAAWALGEGDTMQDLTVQDALRAVLALLDQSGVTVPAPPATTPAP